MVVINSNDVSIYSCICYTTLSGRPGGYPDDDLIKLKKKKKLDTRLDNVLRQSYIMPRWAVIFEGSPTLISCCGFSSTQPE